jgi:hypothetical protein
MSTSEAGPKGPSDDPPESYRHPVRTVRITDSLLRRLERLGVDRGVIDVLRRRMRRERRHLTSI